MKRELPILMSTPMVQALREGRKTQTRRVMLIQPMEGFKFAKKDGQLVQPLTIINPGKDIKARYKVGDRLWVRETWVADYNPPFIYYRADGIPNIPRELKWRPSIFMPKSAAREWLEVVEVRAERVQDISEEDALAEGVAPLFTREEIDKPKYRSELDLNPMPYTNYLWHGHIGKTITGKQSDAWEHQMSSYKTAKGSFSSLWNVINADRGFGWDVNLWVWVYKFRRVPYGLG